MKRIGFWSKLGVLAGMLALATPAMAGELVVYKSEGGSYKPGQTLDAERPVSLAVGERVTLLASNGAILELVGPYHDVPPSRGAGVAGNGVLETMKMLVSAPRTRSGGLGTTRDARDAIQKAGMTARQKEPWMVDVSRSGNYCLAKDQPLIFWRPVVAETSAITVRYGEDQWRAHARWPEGKERLTPPSGMPIVDGGVYHLDLDGVTTTARLHIMPAGLNNREARSSWMVSKGCSAQVAELNRPQDIQ
ncbi:MAG: hypothetical protein HQL96_16370 [Magnetococcales bacterium]|nr:hypothetical protein [Magnetococcales bacterium]